MRAEERLAHAFMAQHPEDAARMVERTAAVDAAAILADVPPRTGAAVYRSLGPSWAAACVAALPDENVTAIIEELPLDVAGAALRAIEPARRAALLDRIADERRDSLHAMLAYAEDKAGALADPLVLAVPDDITVAHAQRELGRIRRHFPYIYVVARGRALVGTLALRELLAASRKEPLAAVMRRSPICLNADTDLATVAMHPAWRDFDALPVVDSDRRLIGAIRHKTIRRLNLPPTRPMMETIVGLSELYWTGLSGILASLSTTPAHAENKNHVV
jgi:magnesium transporter